MNMKSAQISVGEAQLYLGDNFMQNSAYVGFTEQ